MSKITALPVADVHTIIPCTGHSMPESALTQRDDMQQAREQLEEAEKQVEELTMWVKRCRNGLFEPQRVNQCGGYIEMTTITSKFTKERLIDWAVVAVAERGRDLKDAPESVEAAANLKLAEIALASLTAEPVAWTDEQELRDVEKDGFGYLFTVKPITPHADPCRIVKLFTVPPAQVVSILDDWQTCEKLSDDSYVDNALRELVEDTTGDNGVRVVQAVIRALRDSGLIRTYPDLSQPVDPQISEYEKIMLQAGNSPVIPDGYVFAPIEPTSEMINAALKSHLIVFNPVETYSVMLAAAPKPELTSE